MANYLFFLISVYCRLFRQKVFGRQKRHVLQNNYINVKADICQDGQLPEMTTELRTRDQTNNN